MSGTWADVAATNRGLILEEYDFVRRGGRLPPGLNTYNHRFYPIADDFREGVLTQYKTVDFANFFQSSERIGPWERDIRDSIDKLAAAKVDGIPRRVSDGIEIEPIDSLDIFETRIEIVVPPRFAIDPDLASQQQAASSAGSRLRKSKPQPGGSAMGELVAQVNGSPSSAKVFFDSVKVAIVTGKSFGGFSGVGSVWLVIRH